MTIDWSDEAVLTYNKTIDYLLEEWNADIAENFETKTNSLLDRLKTHKHLCPESNIIHLRKCVLHKNTSLIYRVKNDIIELVAFINNNTEHIF